jgi:hypothetical protein
MPIEHPPPTDASVKFLYAHAFRCAYENCQRPLYRVEEQTGERILNSRICHICARREGGPRWDPNQSGEDNRSQQNLVLMCVEHASTIDEPSTLNAYPADLLRGWKRKQLEEYDRLKQGWAIDTEMAREAIENSFSNVEVLVQNSNLGSEGGKGPGAGGGGGGAIGPNSRGGQGGPGGAHRIDRGDYTLPWSEQPLAELDPALGFYPGAGGGGAGAIGDGAIGGDGGGGGERVSARIETAALNEAGFDRIEFTVGKGGEHGAKGEDTVLKYVAKDGAVLKTMRAKGGQSGAAFLPDGVAEISAVDINEGHFRIATLMALNAAEFRENLLFALGADWDTFSVTSMPSAVVWHIYCTARWRTLPVPGARGMFISLIHPAGHEASRQTLIIPAEVIGAHHFIPAHHFIHQLPATIDAEGVWTVRVHSGGFVLSELDLRVPPPPEK